MPAECPKCGKKKWYDPVCPHCGHIAPKADKKDDKIKKQIGATPAGPEQMSGSTSDADLAMSVKKVAKAKIDEHLSARQKAKRRKESNVWRLSQLMGDRVGVHGETVPGRSELRTPDPEKKRALLEQRIQELKDMPAPTLDAMSDDLDRAKFKKAKAYVQSLVAQKLKR